MSQCRVAGEVPEWAASLWLCAVGQCRGGVPCLRMRAGNQRLRLVTVPGGIPREWPRGPPGSEAERPGHPAHGCALEDNIRSLENQLGC